MCADVGFIFSLRRFIDKPPGDRNAMPFGIHALDITHVITVLGDGTRTASETCAHQPAAGKPGARTDQSPLTTPDSGPGRSSEGRSHCSAGDTGGDPGLIWGNAFDLSQGELSANGIIATELIKAPAGSREYQNTGPRRQCAAGRQDNDG
jgi:hypothetical protein